jgi:hypothetical protein
MTFIVRRCEFIKTVGCTLAHTHTPSKEQSKTTMIFKKKKREKDTVL